MKIWISICCFWLLAGCNPNPGQPQQKIAKQKHYKTDLQFISIAYTDVYGKSIPPDELNKARELFLSQGDGVLNRTAWVNYLLSDTSNELQGKTLLSRSPEQFISFCFKKFYLRYPTQQEEEDLKALLQSTDQNLRDWYFAFMSSKEYALL